MGKIIFFNDDFEPNGLIIGDFAKHKIKGNALYKSFNKDEPLD